MTDTPDLRKIVIKRTRPGGHPDTMGIARDAYAPVPSVVPPPGTLGLEVGFRSGGLAHAAYPEADESKHETMTATALQSLAPRFAQVVAV